MKYDICREFIYHLDRDSDLQCGHAPDEIQAWIRELPLPSGLCPMLCWAWPQAGDYVAHVCIFPSESIKRHEMTDLLLKSQFLNAGSAPSGDMFVIDFSTEDCAVGFVTHEGWNPWSDEPGDPRSSYQPIARSLSTFLYRAVEGRYLPTDYYAAKAFNEFLAEEGESL